MPDPSMPSRKRSSRTGSSDVDFRVVVTLRLRSEHSTSIGNASQNHVLSGSIHCKARGALANADYGPHGGHWASTALPAPLLCETCRLLDRCETYQTSHT